MKFELDNYFYVTGITRSGNHAIQTWLTGLPTGPVIKLNFCSSINGGGMKRLAAEYKEPNTSLIQGAEEGHPIGHKPPSPDKITYKNLKEVLILRNPLNNFASKAKYEKNWFKEEHIATFLKNWLEYAEEFAGQTHKLSARVGVNYDRWFSSLEYRKELAQQLGVPFSDSKLNEQDTNWGVSSFDGYSCQGRAQEMKVLERWRFFEEDERFLRFVSALQAHAAYGLYRQIYGELPDSLRGECSECGDI